MSYEVSFINPGRAFESRRDEIMATIEDVLERGDLVLRGDLEEFEAKLADRVGTEYAVGVGSGTDAVHLGLRAAGIGPGDEVITVAHTCVATVSAIIHAGADPVLVDVKDDYTIDEDAIEVAINEDTAAILPVHLNGRAAEMSAIMDLADDHDLTVVEDAAQALGATYAGHGAGSIGDLGCFSFYPFKMLGGLGDGGAIVTDDPEIRDRIQQLRDYGEDAEAGRIRRHGFNSRIDNLNAAVLRENLNHLSEWIETRREHAAIYHRELDGVGDLVLPDFSEEYRRDVYMNYTIRTRRRDELVDHLMENGVEPLTPTSFDPPIHEHEDLGLQDFTLPTTEQIAKEFAYLPVAPELELKQIELAANEIKRFFQTTE
jgi:dTDP-4-amino-4,6-dideoxygalactose transaminase